MQGEPVFDGATLECDKVQKTFLLKDRTPRRVIDDLTLRVEAGEFAVILGPSGCGKTTLLRIFSGLLRPDAGAVYVRGEEVRSVPRDVAVVFQEYNKSLFPWLTLDRNVRFALQGLPKEVAKERARKALAQVGLAESAHQYPWQVSGGMQQRTAIARALACEAKLVIMDEPFASVDALTRIQLEQMMLDIWSRVGFSVVFVTHDIEEAVFLADRIFVLSGRPTSVKEEIVVDLPRPRDPLATKALPKFQELREEVFKLIDKSQMEDNQDRLLG